MSSDGPVIPAEWVDLVRGKLLREDIPTVPPIDILKPKSLKVNNVDTVAGSNIPRSMPDACLNILRSIQKFDKNSYQVPDDELNLSLDHILSRVPYKTMLEDLFSNNSTSCPNVSIVTKLYEESYMREPIDTNERHCIMGDKCECMNLSKTGGFIAVEFLLPGEKPGDISNMCVICHRMFVQSLFYDMIYSGKSHRGVIQKYGNICGQSGEYARGIMLICPPNGPVECMPFPSVSHQRNRYTKVVKSGIKYMQQNGVSFEDFHIPPSVVR
jgi:hypothetical protein